MYNISRYSKRIMFDVLPHIQYTPIKVTLCVLCVRRDRKRHKIMEGNNFIFSHYVVGATGLVSSYLLF